jgi:hypothetical protein
VNRTRLRRRVLGAGIAAALLTAAACGPRQPSGTWYDQFLPSPGATGTVTQSTAIGVGCAPDQTCLVTGWSHVAETGYVPFAMTWRSGRWTRLPAPPQTVHTVSCASAVRCAAATGLGGVAAWDGQAWHTASNTQLWQTDLNGAAPRSVSCGGARGECLALAYGRTARWDGRQWTTGPTLDGMTSLSCATAGGCLAAGARDGQVALQRWTGTAWSPGPSLAHPSLRIELVESIDCWAMDRCVLLARGPLVPIPGSPHDFSTTWTVATLGGASATWSDPPTQLRQLTCVSAQRCIALPVVDQPLVLDGTAWHPAPIVVEDADISMFHLSCLPTWCLGAGSVRDPRRGPASEWQAPTVFRWVF